MENPFYQPPVVAGGRQARTDTFYAPHDEKADPVSKLTTGDRNEWVGRSTFRQTYDHPDRMTR